MFGGLHCNEKLVKNDVWLIKTGLDPFSVTRVSTINEGPSPRVGHSALLVGNAFIGKDILRITLYAFRSLTLTI
jgi:hypothetical protein